MAEDRTLFVHHPPVWWLPSIAVVKADMRNRWCVVIWLHTDCIETIPSYTFTWWLQLRPWWPPLMFCRGWMEWNET